MSLKITCQTRDSTLTFGGSCSSPAPGQPAVSPNSSCLIDPQVSPVFFAKSKVWFQPEDLSAPVPPPPVTQQAYGASYYAVFSPSAVSGMFQQAWAWCWDDSASPFNGTPGTSSIACLKAQVSAWLAAVAPLQGSIISKPPQVTWSEGSGTYSVLADSFSAGPAPISQGLWTPTWGESVQLYCNEASAYNLLSGFPMVWQAGGLPADARLCMERGTVQAGGGQVSLGQEYPSLSSMSPVSSIALVSSILPTLPEQESQPSVFLASGDVAAQATSNEEFNVATDVSVAGQPTGVASGFVSYAPSGVYRWTNLASSDAPVKDLAISLYWRHAHNGQLFPVSLAPSGSAEIKILLQRIDID